MESTQDNSGENYYVGKYVLAIKDITVAIKKLVVSDNIEINPLILNQIGKIQEFSEKLFKSLKQKTGSAEQEGKILELKKHLDNVKIQARELEKENKNENNKIKIHYTNKLSECTKLMQEQSNELQKLRKILEETRQDLGNAKVIEYNILGIH